MTQVFTNDRLIPVTVVEVGPCVVTQIKSKEKDGYASVQIGYGEIKDKHLNKPMKGHFAKNKAKPSRYLAEYRLEDQKQAPENGSVIACDVFEAGEITDVSAVSKGKGFQGVMKRWGFGGGPGGHGSHFHRTPGSIGMAATPSRVFKGMKMAGHMGSDKVTVKNLEIIKVDPSQNVILLKGAVPGGKGSLVLLEATGKKVREPAKLVEVSSQESTAKAGQAVVGSEPKEKKPSAQEQIPDSSNQKPEKEQQVEEKPTEKVKDKAQKTDEEVGDKKEESKE